LILASVKPHILTKSLFEVDIGFSLVFGANMPSFSLPKIH
jgi:hypothetical protein